MAQMGARHGHYNMTLHSQGELVEKGLRVSHIIRGIAQLDDSN
jgi:hypothetical protein